jgi:exodeoxyribonuclease-3
MKLISWNVNGIRACVNKGFVEFFKKIDADIFCIQETKCQPEQINLEFEGYKSYWNSAEKKGYSGTAIFTKKEPINVTYGIGIEEHDKEGRIITIEFDSFYLVNNYTPNSKRELERLEYRQIWEDEIRKYLLKLNEIKPVIMCGDLNVAHKEIDLKNPKTNRGNAGFTDEEREKMTQLLEAGFTDSFRYLYPNKENAYSWWSYMGRAREKNIGWRIDYFIVSNDIQGKIKEATIYPEIMGSDHCPVGLEMQD